MNLSVVLVCLLASAWFGIVGFYFASTQPDAETVEQ